VDLIDPEGLIRTFGTVGLLLAVFAESGLLVGLLLPGDSLLFVAGLLASRGALNLPVILLGSFAAAVAGDQVGYAFGTRVGPALFRRPDGRIFRQSHVAKAQGYFDRYGPRTIVLARFIPLVRTFAPILAGASRMNHRVFTTYNVVGALVWAVGVVSLGYVLGEAIPDIDRYLLPGVGVIVLASLVPVSLEIRKMRRESRARALAGDEGQG